LALWTKLGPADAPQQTALDGPQTVARPSERRQAERKT
jgi:hypothetical protein